MSFWYITQPMVYMLIDQSYGITVRMEANTTGGTATFDILQALNILWGPALVVIILVWMLISAQRSDYRSEYYGPQGY